MEGRKEKDERGDIFAYLKFVIFLPLTFIFST